MDENILSDAEGMMDDEPYTLVDEDGNEMKFELIAQAEFKGQQYYAFVPVDEEQNDDEFCEYTILKLVVEDGEETLVSIEDPDEEDDVADYFDDLFSEEIDYDAQPETK